MTRGRAAVKTARPWCASCLALRRSDAAGSEWAAMAATLANALLPRSWWSTVTTWTPHLATLFLLLSWTHAGGRERLQRIRLPGAVIPCSPNNSPLISIRFFDIVSKKHCTAIDSNGELCKGRPKLMPKKVRHSNFDIHPDILKTNKTETRGHRFWVACDGWKKEFKENHRTYSIPDYVKEPLLIKLFAGEPIADDDSKDTPPCSRIVPPRTGLKQKHCRTFIKFFCAS